jgi:predicted RNase H-like HicB family nuclease
MELAIEYEQEQDGRWIAQVSGIPASVLVYGDTQAEARRNAQASALFALSYLLEQGQAEAVPEIRFTDAA